ncbi:MAG TPA: 50S ribosomal protein L13 [Candidatus Saccharimonadales bacterium]|jgi:large subunit ribosomal protein L13|nr:50S ribosomal protein L13 [Candidatus Saccharimonadales bacterium]
MKTHSVKPNEVTRKWYIIDASTASFGRISTEAARLLLGKDKPHFSHHIDCGDYVIVINSDKLVATGAKLDKKMYYSHSGYPGALKEMTLGEKMKKDSTQVIHHAVRGMLPDNKLRAERLARLKIYPGEEHPHDPQKPINLSKKAGS